MNTLKAEEIFLPNKKINMKKWSVVACDQFTSEPNYWKKLENFVDNNPSTLKITFPEVYLSENNKIRIDKINDTMKQYLSDGVLERKGKCFVLVDRQTPYNKHRLGLVVNIDLEAYSFRVEDKAKIRATEKTVIERIPPRVEIRKNAVFELPHILVLFDDRQQKIIENLYKNRKALEKLYSFKMNMKGGKITGYQVVNTDEIISQFEKLLDKKYLQDAFGTIEEMQFAVGDGNHSLATAKAHWDALKSNLNDDEKLTHPARFALVELENIHDKGLTFNPIYRVVFNVDNNFIKGLKTLNVGKDTVVCKLIINNKIEDINLPKSSPFAVKIIQDYIDDCIKANPNISVDYVHGLDSLKDVCKAHERSVGITLPSLDKCDLFKYVLKHGLLTRKTFSIGEAVEKRYYIEAHKIIK